MDHAVLGTSGMRVSRLVLGTATFGVAPLEKEADRVVGAALDAGINMVDTANAYGNLAHFDREGVVPAAQRTSAEEIIGAVLGSRRDSLLLSTKASEQVGPGVNDSGLSRRHLVEQLDRSLRRLRTDHVDLFYAHHPDPDTPLDETLYVLDELVRSGKTRTYGLSTYPAWQTMHALWICDRRNLRTPACLQVRYNLVARQVESEIAPLAGEFGLSLLAFSPIAGGLLTTAEARERPYTGETRWGGGAFTDSQVAAAARLEEIARRWGHPPARLALAWLLRRPSVAAAIIGPESAEQVATSAAAVPLARELGDEQLAELDTIGSAGIVDPRPRPSRARS
ncbi:MAG: aldo/keto reductase [Actinomycetota bacterium]|nr:aldo/keto reductase [Actinomycetota bacterium]